MNESPKPGPHLFRNTRSTAVPVYRGPQRSAQQPHGFTDSIPPRGDASLIGYADTGLLFAFGSATEHAIRVAFLERYKNRLRTDDAVRVEVKRWARKDAIRLPKEERPKVNAAKTAERALLVSIELCVQPIDTRLLNAIFDQLCEYDTGGDWRQHREGDPAMTAPRRLEQHAGEAVLIAHAFSQADSLLLTNDAGASAIAANRGIKAWHFGHVLRELVCNSKGSLSVAELAKTFASAMSIAGIRDDLRPKDLNNWMTCVGLAGGTCAVCAST